MISERELKEFFRKWEPSLRKEIEEVQKELKSILTPEEFKEFLEERKKVKFRLVGEYDEHEKERLEKKAKAEVEEFLKNYGNKQFLISKKFFSYASEALYQSLRWSKELPIIGIFKKKDDKMILESFLKYDWLLNNGYARSFGASTIYVMNEGKGEIFSIKVVLEWSLKKLEKLKSGIEKIGRYPICFHTHAGKASLSKGDTQVSGIGGVVGFKTLNKELEKLISDSYRTSLFRRNNPRFKRVKLSLDKLIEKIENSDIPSYKKKIETDFVKKVYPEGIKIYELQPYEIDKFLWSRIRRECSPTIRLFAWLANQEPVSIPLYLDGSIL